MNVTKPGIGDIVAPLRLGAIAAEKNPKGSGWVTRIFFYPRHRQWRANTIPSKAGLVCFIGGPPEAHHDICISRIGERSVRGSLVVNHKRIDYVEILSKAMIGVEFRQDIHMIFQDCDIFKLADQLAEKVPGGSFEHMIPFLRSALSNRDLENLRIELLNSEFDHGGQNAWILREKMPDI